VFYQQRLRTPIEMNDEVVRELVGFESLEVTRLNVSSCVINVRTRASLCPPFTFPPFNR